MSQPQKKAIGQMEALLLKKQQMRSQINYEVQTLTDAINLMKDDMNKREPKTNPDD